MPARFLLLVFVSAAVGCSGDPAPTAPNDDAAAFDGPTENAAPTSDAVPPAFDAEASIAPVDAFDAVITLRPDSPPNGASTLGAIDCSPMAGPYPSPLPANPQPTLVPIAPPGGISFLEGPVWLADRGILLFSEWNEGHRILQLTPPQTVDVFMPATGSNGLAITPDGKSLLMVTEMPSASVSQISLADKSVMKLAQDYNGQGFIQPNDLVVRADGTLYFSDYQAGRLYRRATTGTLSLVSSVTHANGVGVSPDEKTLYLNADTHTVKYPLAQDGTVGEGTDLATGLDGADGIAIDCAGNVYIAQNARGSVIVVSAAGNRIGEIGGLPQIVTNAAFGGSDRRTLYITTNTALYAIQLQVPGLPY